MIPKNRRFQQFAPVCRVCAARRVFVLGLILACYLSPSACRFASCAGDPSSSAAASPPAGDGGWPQLQCNPQRTGYTPVCPAPPYRVVWQWSPMPDDVLNSVAQPIATRKAVFMPTNHGMLYALAASDGKELWKARLGRGCFHSAACENDRVFAASLDGYVVAFGVGTGKELWRTRGPGLVGFVTAPLLAEGSSTRNCPSCSLLAV